MTDTNIIEDKARDYDYHKTLHEGAVYSHKKAKHIKDKKVTPQYKCTCEWCVDGKLHKHKRKMDAMSVEDGITLMYYLSEDCLDDEFSGAGD